ncbi:hypothetical protein EVAR_99716_1 [Eumeta japonica]|uniref:Histone-lysine N-methyltransferase SETMAR n=1 Tax=Eumeta variegata TaxID=151549 RepID=A0A4C1ZLS5_EUMVA|nr:hypothetical protein EVAR_99716_1 [Eumeta japonica]
MDEFKEGRPKSVVVAQNIDSVRELIIQDRHVTYREMKASLGINIEKYVNSLKKERAKVREATRKLPLVVIRDVQKNNTDEDIVSRSRNKTNTPPQISTGAASK